MKMKDNRVNQKSESPLHFARFEFKYVLPESKRFAVEKDMGYFVELDSFVAQQNGSQYHVRSLYYDDPALTCFYDKINGMCTRSKFRIRTYPTNARELSPVYLEIKGRHNNLVFKHRTRIENVDSKWMTLTGGELSNAVAQSNNNSRVMEQFRFELARKRLSPITMIDYMRRPYVSKFNPGFRVTFDQALTARRTDCLFPSDQTVAMKLIAGYTVLEVKFLHHLPSWFHRIIQVHELQRVSISKICVGMETLGLAVDENG
jgi:hypothetical protein